MLWKLPGNRHALEITEIHYCTCKNYHIIGVFLWFPLESWLSWLKWLMTLSSGFQSSAADNRGTTVLFGTNWIFSSPSVIGFDPALISMIDYINRKNGFDKHSYRSFSSSHCNIFTAKYFNWILFGQTQKSFGKREMDFIVASLRCTHSFHISKIYPFFFANSESFFWSRVGRI